MQGTPAAAAALRDAERGLAERGLGVDPALAGDHEVRVRELAVEVGRSMTSSTPGRRCERPEAILDARAARTRRRRRRRRPVSRARRDRSLAASSRDQLASRASSSSTWSREAPFCGPYVAAAPGRAEQRVRHVARDLDIDRLRDCGSSVEVERASRSPSSPAPPSPASSPRPPSVVALPPIPRTIRVAPASAAILISSPVPSDVAAIGSRSSAPDPRQPGRLGHLDDRRAAVGRPQPARR